MTIWLADFVCTKLDESVIWIRHIFDHVENTLIGFQSKNIKTVESRQLTVDLREIYKDVDERCNLYKAQVWGAICKK